MSICPPFLLASTGKHTELYLSPNGPKSRACRTGSIPESMHLAWFSTTGQPRKGEIAWQHTVS